MYTVKCGRIEIENGQYINLMVLVQVQLAV